MTEDWSNDWKCSLASTNKQNMQQQQKKTVLLNLNISQYY